MLDTREQTIAAYSISCIRRASLGGSEAAERRCGESANIGVSRSWPLVADESGPISRAPIPIDGMWKRGLGDTKCGLPTLTNRGSVQHPS